jgi:hypothetical protein
MWHLRWHKEDSKWIVAVFINFECEWDIQESTLIECMFGIYMYTCWIPLPVNLNFLIVAF